MHWMQRVAGPVAGSCLLWALAGCGEDSTANNDAATASDAKADAGSLDGAVADGASLDSSGDSGKDGGGGNKITTAHGDRMTPTP